MENHAAWVVWSFEHQGWWRPKAEGYTPDLEEAGKFSRVEAGLYATMDITGGDVAISLSQAEREGPPTVKGLWQ